MVMQKPATTNEIAGEPQPIKVFPKTTAAPWIKQIEVIWSPLGKPCEIDSCGAPAYAICD